MRVTITSYEIEKYVRPEKIPDGTLLETTAGSVYLKLEERKYVLIVGSNGLALSTPVFYNEPVSNACRLFKGSIELSND